jgi:hypothetical protein
MKRTDPPDAQTPVAYDQSPAKIEPVRAMPAYLASKKKKKKNKKTRAGDTQAHRRHMHKNLNTGDAPTVIPFTGDEGLERVQDISSIIPPWQRKKYVPAYQRLISEWSKQPAHSETLPVSVRAPIHDIISGKVPYGVVHTCLVAKRAAKESMELVSDAAAAAAALVASYAAVSAAIAVFKVVPLVERLTAMSPSHVYTLKELASTACASAAEAAMYTAAEAMARAAAAVPSPWHVEWGALRARLAEERAEDEDERLQDAITEEMAARAEESGEESGEDGIEASIRRRMVRPTSARAITPSAHVKPTATLSKDAFREWQRRRRGVNGSINRGDKKHLQRNNEQDEEREEKEREEERREKGEREEEEEQEEEEQEE